MRDAGRGIRHRFYRAIARNARQALPVLRGQYVRVLHRVGVPRIGLERDDEVVPGFGGREERRRWPDPKTALDGKGGVGGHGGEGLGDGAAQLKTGAAAECRAAAGNHAADDGEPRAALGERGSREANQQEQEQDSHRCWKFILCLRQ